MGVVVWPMVEQEADDALAAAAARAARDPAVGKVWICTPDKDLAQSVVGGRVVQFDRRKGIERDETGVREKFGVGPGSIPDYLALVGDTADGIPGIPGWGPKAAGVVLDRFEHIEQIPEDAADWKVSVRGAARLADTLRERRADALLYKRLATLRVDAHVFDGVDELRWAGPWREFETRAAALNAVALWTRASALGADRKSGS
jgi:5'-3' exonuclease